MIEKNICFLHLAQDYLFPFSIFLIFVEKPNLSSGSDGKESACNAGDPALIPGSGRSPGERSGDPRQYSYLGNLMERGAWQTIVHGVPRQLDMRRARQITSVCLPGEFQGQRSLVG